jgi:hypothetical protein
MKELRKLYARFKTEKDLESLSEKLNCCKLLPNMKSVTITENGYEVEYRKVVKRASKAEKEWERHWKDLTPYSNAEDDYLCEILFYFDSEWTNEKLKELFVQNISDKTKNVYVPIKEPAFFMRSRVIGDRNQPKYPIYVISKGRYEKCLTADYLIKMNVDFKIIVEKQELELYAQYYGMDRLIELDMSFKDAYDTYIPNFDPNKSKGSGPARNFVWWHAKNVVKSDWHWIMDDNILGFYYYTENQRIRAADGTVFCAAEDFIDRYDNIAISGLNYKMFIVPGTKDRPYVANTKIYSCLLINNHVDIRWAGRYNEDVDLCIRALKEGYSTIQFDTFSADKLATQTMGGGNTDEFYAEEGTLPKSNQLANNHPDITKVCWRFCRWHHHTDYDIFDVYKDRTIEETIRALSRPQILDPENSEDIKIIEEIRNMTLVDIEDWDEILLGLDKIKRDGVLSIMKWLRYSKDNERIISELTRARILECDLDTYIWGDEVPETLDNKVMIDLLNLSEEDQLRKHVDWDSYLDYLDEDRRNIIAKEMTRNKYLLKDYEGYDYNLQRIQLTEEEHENYLDSKNHIMNRYFGQNLEIPTIRFDENKRNGGTRMKTSFTKQLTQRNTAHKKEQERRAVMVHGDESFNNKHVFCDSINGREFEEIISSVNYDIDLMVANYSLKNGIPNKNFVPDENRYGPAAYKNMYDNMSEYADELVLFCESKLSDNMLYLVKSFEDKNKPVELIIENQGTKIEEW